MSTARAPRRGPARAVHEPDRAPDPQAVARIVADWLIPELARRFTENKEAPTDDRDR